MKCAVHPDVEASGFCRNCGKPMCPACVRPIRDVLYCEDCLANVMGLSAPPPLSTSVTPSATPGASAILPPAATTPTPGGNPGIAFLLGLVPGLGAIYNGEYNKALIHIVIFAGIILGLSSDLGQGATAIFVLAVVIFPLYMAIDALKTAKARNAGQPVQDPLENWSKARPIGPLVLIVLGVFLLLNNFNFFDFFRVRQIFWPLVLIVVGVFMIRNRISGQN